MLMGEFHHNLDEKNRLVIPTKYREELGNDFVIAKGIENCLYLYSNIKWNELVNKLSELSFTKKDTRIFTRTFFSGASVSEFDANGRINITSPLVNYAGLTKKCVIIGVNDHLEIWDEDVYNKILCENASKLEEIAEDLFENISL